MASSTGRQRAAEKRPGKHDEALRLPSRRQPPVVDAQHHVARGEGEQRAAAGVVLYARIDGGRIQGLAHASPHGHDQVSLPVAAAFELQPDRDVPVAQAPCRRRLAPQEPQRSGFDARVGQQPGKAGEEAGAGSVERHHGGHDEEEVRAGSCQASSLVFRVTPSSIVVSISADFGLDVAAGIDENQLAPVAGRDESGPVEQVRCSGAARGDDRAVAW